MGPDVEMLDGRYYPEPVGAGSAGPALLDGDGIVRNAVQCRICGAGADRHSTHYQCRANSAHVGDLWVGIFTDLTPPNIR
jgi:hypothetical protein